MSAAPREPEIFRRRTVIALGVISAASLLVALLLSALSGDLAEVPTAGPSAYSRSALGYAALARLLTESGVPTLVSRHDSAGKTGPSHPLLLAEPGVRRSSARAASDDDESTTEAPSIQELLAAADRREAAVVVVLPKWRGRPMRLQTGWIERAELRPASDAAEVLAAVGGNSITASAIVRPGALTGLHGRLPGGELPVLPEPQVIRPDALLLQALVASDEGVLIGQIAGTRVYVVADPDLLNTAGLARGDNAVVAHRFLAEYLEPEGFILDETSHGFAREPSLTSELLQFPLALVTLHLAGLFALLLWATMGRFGKPEPMPPRLAPGKRALVDNTAELVGLGGFTAHGLRRYTQMTLREGAVACALPSGLGEDEQVAELAAISRRRGLTADVGALYAEVRALESRGPKARGDARRALQIARSLHHWQKDLLRGNR